mmetsp:Transcript_41834/g.99307  ORF Transcript_41834/g.99307 Transcript_41834/m.99307 type:complete len:377 (-) Transcript_41834:829-1959(-)
MRLEQRDKLRVRWIRRVAEPPDVEGDMPVRAPHYLPRAAARAGDPVDEILRGAERGGEGHKLDGLGEVDDGLLPDRTPLRIVDVVHLVRHDAAEPLEVRVLHVHPPRLCPRLPAQRFDQFVAEDLGRADHELVLGSGRRADLDVSGQEGYLAVHPLGAEPLLELRILLVRKSLDRRRVDSPLPSGERLKNSQQRHRCLPGPRGSHSEEVRLLLEDDRERAPLEIVDRVAHHISCNLNRIVEVLHRLDEHSSIPRRHVEILLLPKLFCPPPPPCGFGPHCLRRCIPRPVVTKPSHVIHAEDLPPRRQLRDARDADAKLGAARLEHPAQLHLALEALGEVGSDGRSEVGVAQLDPHPPRRRVHHEGFPVVGPLDGREE